MPVQQWLLCPVRAGMPTTHNGQISLLQYGASAKASKQLIGLFIPVIFYLFGTRSPQKIAMHAPKQKGLILLRSAAGSVPFAYILLYIYSISVECVFTPPLLNVVKCK